MVAHLKNEVPMPTPTRYLVHIRFKGPLTPSRIKLSTKTAMDTLTKMAMSPQELVLAYASADAGTLGCLIKTSDFANGIKRKLDECGNLGAEQILVVEIGSETACLNLGNAQRWLQHH